MEGEGGAHHPFPTLLQHTLTSIISHRKPLSHISLSLALPMSLLLLIDLHLPRFSTLPLTHPTTLATFLLQKASHQLLLLTLTLLSTTCIVRAITTSPTHPSTSHTPLAITLLCTHFLFLSWKAAAVGAVTLGGLLAGHGPAGLAVIVAASAAYVAGLACAGAAWVLACVVAVAEGEGGAAAWRRARELARGREVSGAAWFLGFWLAFNVVKLAYVGVVVEGSGVGVWWRSVGGGLLAVLMTGVVVAGTVAATAAYETCKAEEEEEGWYLGEYVLVEGRKMPKVHEQGIDP